MNEPILQAREPACTSLQFQAVPPHRILVVDDDHGIRRLSTEALKRSGYQVDAAEDGSAAWDALHVNGYHLLITDNDMPKMSGIELLKKLRAARIHVPVIMAAGALPHDEFIRHPNLRPAATLLKPYTIGDLIRMVKKVLRAACDGIIPARMHGGCGAFADESNLYIL